MILSILIQLNICNGNGVHLEFIVTHKITLYHIDSFYDFVFVSNKIVISHACLVQNVNT